MYLANIHSTTFLIKKYKKCDEDSLTESFVELKSMVQYLFWCTHEMSISLLVYFGNFTKLYIDQQHPQQSIISLICIISCHENLSLFNQY